MAVSAKDIALRLGISAATVSMVLNNKPGISDETRKRVIQTAREMGYDKKSLDSSTQPHPLQLVVFKSHGEIVGDTSFFLELIQEMDAAAKEQQFHLMVTYFYRNQDVSRQLQTITASGCAGIVLLATEMTEEQLFPFEQLGLPLVLLDNTFPARRVSSVMIDNFYGSLCAVTHLIAQGHTEIGHLRSSVEIRNFQERRQGFLVGVSQITVPNASSAHTIVVPPSVTGAYTVMMEYLSEHTLPCTALFADNDIIATSCMRALREYGYRIPEDVSIVGFDDMPMCELFDPPLTSIHVPKAAISRLAVAQLLQMIRNPDQACIRAAVLTSLAERNSVAAPIRPQTSYRAFGDEQTQQG